MMIFLVVGLFIMLLCVLRSYMISVGGAAARTDVQAKTAVDLHSSIYAPRNSEGNRLAWYWERIQPPASIEEVRKYLIGELNKLQLTDWQYYVTLQILDQSADLQDLMHNRKIDIEWMKKQECKGIYDAINILKKLGEKNHISLRALFHDVFEKITAIGKRNNRFYKQGLKKVMAALKAYDPDKNEIDWREYRPLDVFDRGKNRDENERMKYYRKDVFNQLSGIFNLIENDKREWHDKYLRFGRVIEFDLKTIPGYASGEVTVNGIYLTFRDMLSKIISNEYAHEVNFCTPYFDTLYCEFPYGDKQVILVKIRPIINTAPEMIYIDMNEIDEDDPLIAKLKALKMHVEKND